jgi:soluble epoxide hydrolase/lipid-phosphate phosphatase
VSQATLAYPADPSIWIANICAPGGMEAWIKAKKVTELAPWVKQSELETHGKIIKPGGMTGPLNWYKQAMAGVTHTSEAKVNANYAATKFSLPALFIGCERDMICIPALQEAPMKDFFEDLTVKSLDTSHWIMIEKPKEMWEIVQGWIEEKGK